MQREFGQSKGLDKVLRRQQILAKQLKLTAEVVAPITCCQGDGGGSADTLKPAPARSPQVFPEMPSPQSIHQVFDNVLEKNDVSSQAEDVVFTDSVAWKGPADERSNETTRADVVWDDELEHYHGSHGGLLQLLAGGGEYPDEELMESGQGNYLLQQDIVMPDAPWMFVGMSQGSVHSVISEMGHTVTWDEDLQQVLDEYGSLTQPAHGEEGLEAVCSVFDERPQLDVLWDEEMQSDTHMHDSLLQ
ncbi:unnamed protein product [Urochloa humidicola]